jgi:hypothetical protein
MGLNKRKMEAARRQEAEKEAATRRATDRQILEDAAQLVAAWNKRQAKQMPMLFSPTIGASITAGYWFLRARCPACRTTGDVNLRALEVLPRTITRSVAAISGSASKRRAGRSGVISSRLCHASVSKVPRWSCDNRPVAWLLHVRMLSWSNGDDD